MGAGASSLNRLRKAVVIRAYNLREPDATVDDQFRRFAVRAADNSLYITISNVRKCLGMESKEHEWVDDLLHHAFGTQVADIAYFDFIRFLESGKPPSIGIGSKGNDCKPKDNSASNGTKFDGRAVGTPPLPPHKTSSPVTSLPPTLTPSGSYRSIADAASIRIERVADSSACKAAGDTAEEDAEVININLSSAVANPHSLPESVKLHSTEGSHVVSWESRRGEEQEEPPLSLIIHPSKCSSQLGGAGSPKPLWRKRETVRQERTVHYTTIDASGEQQELIERETTQSEVLHMECKETGEFAHRETTQYEQMETFNEEIVAATKGAEEYVHLKSKEDEFHYMESTMPNKGGPEEAIPGAERQDGADAGPSSDGAEAAGDDVDAEYAEAYRLYQQKQQEEAGERYRPAEGEGDGTDGFGSAPADGVRAPPPFSDDSAGATYGFEGSAGDRCRAEDAFAYAARLDEDFLQGATASEEDASPLYGERVTVEEDRGWGEAEKNEHGVGERLPAQAHRASRDHLFDPAVDLTTGFAPPKPQAQEEEEQGGASEAENAMEETPSGRSPVRSSSYVSLHEID